MIFSALGSIPSPRDSASGERDRVRGLVPSLRDEGARRGLGRGVWLRRARKVSRLLTPALSSLAGSGREGVRTPPLPLQAPESSKTSAFRILRAPLSLSPHGIG